MKDVLARIILGMLVSVVLFIMWRCGVWVDSLLTMRTPLYFALHNWASLIVCPIVGLLFAIFFDRH